MRGKNANYLSHTEILICIGSENNKKQRKYVTDNR